MDKCSMRGLAILSGTLERVRKRPPTPQAQLDTLHEPIEYLYNAYAFVARNMAEKGYQMPPQTEVDVTYEQWVEFEENSQAMCKAQVESMGGTKTLIEQTLQAVKDETKRRERSKVSKKVQKEDTSEDEAEWSDVSVNSTNSRASRSNSLIAAKSRLKRNMCESSEKRSLRIAAQQAESSAASPNSKRQKTTKVATAPQRVTDLNSASDPARRTGEDGGGDDDDNDVFGRISRPRTVKRAPSQNNSQRSASRAPKSVSSNGKPLPNGSSSTGLQQRGTSIDRKAPTLHGNSAAVSRPPSADRAEFARLQNQRVKERLEQQRTQQQSGRSRSKEPSLSSKPKQKPRDQPKGESKTSKGTQKRLQDVVTSKAPQHQPIDTPQLDNQSLLESSKLPQIPNLISSTFLAGGEAQPMFDASMILANQQAVGALLLDGEDIRQTNGFETNTVLSNQAPLNATYAKPPQAQPVEATAKTTMLKTFIPTKFGGSTHSEDLAHAVDDTLYNASEASYCNYGIEDLCSDSDYTDDESAPSKPIPNWANLRSERFARRIAKQKLLGEDINKYGMKQIVVPEFVDLGAIFDGDDVTLQRDTSSLLWDTTQTFLQ